MAASGIQEVDEYWPEVAEDLSLVTWAHATNSQKLVEDAMNDSDVMMVEADILFGHLSNSSAKDEIIPIMAHPPNKQSDLSLEMFIDVVVKNVKEGKKKGIKLDFKEIGVVQPSLEIVKKYISQINFPVWLNADILPGPVHAAPIPLEPSVFLMTCVELLPIATLSVGWTTKFTIEDDPLARYAIITDNDEGDALAMKKILESHHVTQPVTFPVRAAFVKQSLNALTWLVENVPDSTLTVWSSASDDVDIPSLVSLMATAGADRVYFDLPEEQKREFDELRPNHNVSSSATPTVKFWPKDSIFYANIITVISVIFFATLFYLKE